MNDTTTDDALKQTAKERDHEKELLRRVLLTRFIVRQSVLNVRKHEAVCALTGPYETRFYQQGEQHERAHTRILLRFRWDEYRTAASIYREAVRTRKGREYCAEQIRLVRERSARPSSKQEGEKANL